MTIFRVIALSGSLREGSTNSALLRDIGTRVPEEVCFDIFPLGGLPLFNPDLENHVPEAAAHFRAVIVACDAMIIASPEYAHGMSGVLKNALDWLVSCEAFAGKPVLVLNNAPRAHHAIAALRETLSTMAARLVDSIPLIETIVPTPQEGN